MLGDGGVCVGGLRAFLPGVDNEVGRESMYESWTDDSAVLVRHENIVAVFEAIRTRSVADTLLSLFEHPEQAEFA